MSTTRKHYVTFLSPGTFVAESSTLAITEWDPREAMRLASGVKERHGAIPYGFRFETRIVASEVTDGEGGTLQVEPKTVKTSGMYFIGGVVETLADVKARATKADDILISNMECNDYAHIVTTTNGYRWSQEFQKGDHVVNADGEVTR